MTPMKKGLATIAATLTLAATAGAPQAQTMDTVKERGTLKIGVTQAAPWYSKDPRAGGWTGLGVTLGSHLAEDLGVEPELVEVTWATSVAALQANKIDIMLIFSKTPERAEAVDFPERPILYISQALLTNGDIKAETWSELNRADFSVAVPQATTMDKLLSEQVPDADIQRYPDNAAAIAAFQAGRAQSLSLYYAPLLATQQKLGSGEIIAPQPISTEPTSAAVRKEDDKAFVTWVDERLFDYYSSGRTQAWYEETLTAMGMDAKSAPPVQLPQ